MQHIWVAKASGTLTSSTSLGKGGTSFSLMLKGRVRVRVRVSQSQRDTHQFHFPGERGNLVLSYVEGQGAPASFRASEDFVLLKRKRSVWIRPKKARKQGAAPLDGGSEAGCAVLLHPKRADVGAGSISVQHYNARLNYLTKSPLKSRPW